MTDRRGHTRPDLDDILNKLRSRMGDLKERYGVQWLGVFGSYVRGEQKSGSDLDLLVECDERPLTLLQFIALEQELGELLGVKVDLVEKGTLKPYIGRHILQEVIAV